MAKMYPPEVAVDTKSGAERRYFDILRKQLADDWTVLHSLGLAGHKRKPWAEVDFVLIGPPGVFSLEMKGGRISRRDGIWLFTDRDGHTSSKYEGPWQQVGGASSALYKHLESRLPWMKRVAVGYGVVMPDVEFKEQGPDIDPNVLYDARDTERSFGAYVRRLADHWHDRLEAMHGRPLESLGENQRTAILHELRGDFDLRPSLRARVGLAKEQLLSLTVEQYRVLDGLVENKQVIIKGGAGTGKTLLAVEEARRQTAQGDRVFVCCFNVRLAAFLKEALKDCARIDVHGLHSFMHQTVEAAGIRDQLPDAEPDDLFPVFYPIACVDALLLLDRVQDYDVLIVDETQDLLRDGYLSVFDALVKGGLQQGTWRFFLDPYQNLFHGVVAEALDRLQSVRPTQYRLSINCRNTKAIALATLLLSGVVCDTTLHVDGPEVEQQWYRDERHQQRLIGNAVNRLLSEGIRPTDIVVLSRYRKDKSCLRDGLTDVPFALVDTEVSASPRDRSIRFSTIAGFKGLEADAVLVVDIDNLDDPDILRSIYVGASRATAYLALFVDERQKAAYEKRVVEEAAELARRMNNESSVPLR